MSSTDEGLLIYDMYVMDNSGIPIFAGCTTSNYCKEHSDQHPLHTGFIAALQSFGQEVFSGNLLNLSFPKIKVNFRHIGKFTLVFVNPASVDDKLIHNKFEEAVKIFKEKYESNLTGYYVSQEQYQNFNDDMVKIGLIPQDRLQSTKDYFITRDGTTAKPSISIIQKFKQKFFKLTKKH